MSHVWLGTTVLLGCLWLSAQAQTPAPEYVVVTFDLRTVDGQVRGTTPTDLTDALVPTIAANVPLPPEGLEQPGYLLQFPGSVTPIACDPATRITEIQGINQRGDTVGWCFTPDTPIRGFYRTGLGHMTTLAVPGAQVTEAHDVNNARLVVGAFVDQAGAVHGFLWDARTSRFRQIDVPFPGASTTVPLALNNHGAVVGIYEQIPGQAHGFLYDAPTQAWTAIDAPGADVTTLTGINDAGAILGRADTLYAGGSLFVYQDGTFVPLPAPYPVEDWGPINLMAMNNRGQLLGTYEQALPPADPTDPEPPARVLLRGFLATPRPTPAPVGFAALARGHRLAPLGHAQVRGAALVSLALSGCPGDGSQRPGKLMASWTRCAAVPR